MQLRDTRELPSQHLHDTPRVACRPRAAAGRLPARQRAMRPLTAVCTPPRTHLRIAFASRALVLIHLDPGFDMHPDAHAPRATGCMPKPGSKRARTRRAPAKHAPGKVRRGGERGGEVAAVAAAVLLLLLLLPPPPPPSPLLLLQTTTCALSPNWGREGVRGGALHLPVHARTPLSRRLSARCRTRAGWALAGQAGREPSDHTTSERRVRDSRPRT